MPDSQNQDRNARVQTLLTLYSSGMTHYDILHWANETPKDKAGNPIADPAGRPWNITEAELDSLLKQVRQELRKWYRAQNTPDASARLLWRLESAHCTLATTGDVKGASRIAKTIGEIQAAELQRQAAKTPKPANDIEAPEVEFEGTVRHKRAIAAIAQGQSSCRAATPRKHENRPPLRPVPNANLICLTACQ